jgi:hypothetical protein
MNARAQSARSLVEPALIIIIGLALGLVDQASSEVHGMLRVPALIAALVLVGQGVNLFDQARRADTTKITTPDPVSVGATTTTAVPTTPATGPGGQPVNKGQDIVLVATAPGAPGVLPWLVLALSVWLGLATLANPDAPLSLILLSLLAAYLLFARGWRLMAPTAIARR